MKLKVKVRFSAAHRLPRHPGPCARTHGHNYVSELEVEGRLDATSGMVVDLFEVERVARDRILDAFDHRDLNSIMENPTAEMIALAAFRAASADLPGLTCVRVWETDDFCVEVRAEDAREGDKARSEGRAETEFERARLARNRLAESSEAARRLSVKALEGPLSSKDAARLATLERFE